MSLLKTLKRRLVVVCLSVGGAMGLLTWSSTQANWLTGMNNAAVKDISFAAAPILGKSWDSIEMINASERALDLVNFLGGNVLGGVGGATNDGRFGVGVYSYIQTVINQFRPAAVNRPAFHSYDVAYSLPYGNEMGLMNAAKAPIDRSAYFKWQEIAMNAVSGAECMDGSDYKMYVNLTPASSNLLVFMEPGGACIDYETCTGEKPLLNQDGSPKMISVNYDNDPNYSLNLGTFRVRDFVREEPLARNPRGIVKDYILGATDTMLGNYVGTISAAASGRTASASAIQPTRNARPCARSSRRPSSS